ncbi:hypothetical protein K1719_026462 [Acacia pycnantha]|nr:hypothetical protein K1719_026462 [Acacia pycnantha]
MAIGRQRTTAMKAGQAKENDYGPRRPISFSYKEKLLSPGGLGYLVNHAEEDDIVNRWKSFFAQKNVEMETSTGDTEAEKEEAMGDGPPSGYPTLSVTSEQYTMWCRPWMNSLIIKLLGLSVPKHVLIDRVRRMWKPRQPLKVVPLNNDYYIVSFSSMEDRDYGLYEGPWMIDDHYLLVQRWRPNFNPWKADQQGMIPDLPMEFCTVESLGITGNMIGKMIKIDRSTSIYDKGEFALICVEINLQQPLLSAFNAFGEDMQLSTLLVKKSWRRGVHGGDDNVGWQHSKEETTKIVRRFTGGSKHLGPQMILRRDMRRNNQSLADNVGLKSGILEISQGVKRDGVNRDTSRGISNDQKLKEATAAGSVGLSHTTLNEKDKNKGEWVVVGSKRKKEERPKLFRKENISGGRPKSKSNQKGIDHSRPSVIAMTDGFASLNDLTNNNTSIMHGAMQVDVSKEEVLGNNSLNNVGPSHAIC